MKIERAVQEVYVGLNALQEGDFITHVDQRGASPVFRVRRESVTMPPPGIYLDDAGNAWQVFEARPGEAKRLVDGSTDLSLVMGSLRLLYTMNDAGDRISDAMDLKGLPISARSVRKTVRKL